MADEAAYATEIVEGVSRLLMQKVLPKIINVLIWKVQLRKYFKQAKEIFRSGMDTVEIRMRTGENVDARVVPRGQDLPAGKARKFAKMYTKLLYIFAGLTIDGRALDISHDGTLQLASNFQDAFDSMQRGLAFTENRIIMGAGNAKVVQIDASGDYPITISADIDGTGTKTYTVIEVEPTNWANIHHMQGGMNVWFYPDASVSSQPSNGYEVSMVDFENNLLYILGDVTAVALDETLIMTREYIATSDDGWYLEPLGMGAIFSQTNPDWGTIQEVSRANAYNYYMRPIVYDCGGYLTPQKFRLALQKAKAYGARDANHDLIWCSYGVGNSWLLYAEQNNQPTVTLPGALGNMIPSYSYDGKQYVFEQLEQAPRETMFVCSSDDITVADPLGVRSVSNGDSRNNLNWIIRKYEYGLNVGHPFNLVVERFNSQLKLTGIDENVTPYMGH
jgi:hypothetical protein